MVLHMDCPPVDRWMGSWFQLHFLQYAPAVRPLLLLLDGHSSHFRLEFIREASTQGVIVFCLPPNTTHVCQPLDVTPFNSLKVHWDNVCDEFMSTNPGRIVTLYQFCPLFSKAWRMVMVSETIMAGFKAAGVFPPNRKATKIPGEVPDITNTPTAVLARREGINYMPFLSSAQKRTTQPPSESGASPDLEKEGGRQFENEESNESPYFSEEDLAPSYVRQYESGSNTGISKESPYISQRKTWHPVTSDSMRVDLILGSPKSHPISQWKTWHPVTSDSMRVDLIILSVPLDVNLHVSSTSQVLTAAL